MQICNRWLRCQMWWLVVGGGRRVTIAAIDAFTKWIQGVIHFGGNKCKSKHQDYHYSAYQRRSGCSPRYSAAAPERTPDYYSAAVGCCSGTCPLIFCKEEWNYYLSGWSLHHNCTIPLLHLICIGLGDGIRQQLDPFLIVHGGEEVLRLFRHPRMKQQRLVQGCTYRLGVA